MESLFYFLGILLAVAVPAGLVFWAGYSTARAQNAKFRKTIQQSYTTLIAQNRELADAPGTKAHRIGWREGYDQALTDLIANTREQINEP